MSYLSNQAPQVTQQDLWNWIRPGVPFPTFNDYPQNPVNGQFFKHTGVTPNRFFQFDGTGWVNLGPIGSFQVPLVPTGQSPLQIHDTEHEAPNNNGSEASLFLVYINEDNPQVDGPLLMTDRGLVVKKDLIAGGFIDSGQGALWLNYGLVGRPEISSPPCIQLMSSSVPYPSGTQFPDPSPGSYETGQLFNLTSAYYWSQTGKTYPAGKYRWEGNDWIERDYSGNYDTLFLFQDDLITPADLDLGNLTVNGQLEVQDNVLHVARTYSTSDAIVLGRISGDSIGRFYVRADGHMFWGDGTSLDTELMRSAPNTLYTPDGLHVVQSIKADSFFTETNGSGFKCNSGAITWVSLTRDSNTGYLNSHYGNLWLVATSDIHLNPAGNAVYCHKSFHPYGAGTYSQGDYNAYWNEVNAKSFPDRGCPIWIDAEDAKAILKTIKPHPTKKSANKLNGEEVPQFDYSNMHEILKSDSGGDGIKLEVLVYSMYHALMELIEKVESGSETLD